MSIFHNNVLLNAAGNQGGGYVIERSIRINSTDQQYFTISPSTEGNRQTFTLSWWMKRAINGTTNKRIFGKSTGSNQFSIMHEGNNRFYCYFNLDSPTDTSELTFDVKLADTSAWYHCVMAFDTTQATDSDRVKFWLNGVLQNSNMAVSNWPSQNASFKWNEDLDGLVYRIGGLGTDMVNMYLAEIHNIDGQALTADDFGEYSEDYPDVWNPKEYTGSYGTNGFYLDFSDPTSTTTIAQDKSGNGNHFTANNVTVSGTGTDSMLDSPTMGTQSDTGAGGEVSGNYAIFNVNDKGSVTLSDGSLSANASIDNNVKGTLHIPEDVKIYFEFTVDQRGGGGSQSPIVGVCLNNLKMTQNADSQQDKIWAYASTGNKIGGGSGYTAHGNSLSANDVLGVAVDRANGRIWFSKNGTWQNSSDPTDGTDSNAAFTNVPTTGILCFFYGNNNTTPGYGTLNCGQRAFSYNAPSGYKVLCTTSFEDSTIMDGGEYFDTSLWTGNGSTQSITGLAFSPDFVWIKNRNNTADHRVYDTVRGALEELLPNQSNAETTRANSLTAFNSDGYSLGSYGGVNNSGTTAVGWAWDAGSSNASNTSGTIDSVVRANTTSGFSIVSYTSDGSNGDRTVGHGLGKYPEFIIVKNRDDSRDWNVWFDALDDVDKSLILNSTSDVQGLLWVGVPNTTTFQVKGGHQNKASNDMIAYLWNAVEGFSTFGQYLGTGNSDGPFIYCGFKPAWIIYKSEDETSAATDWFIRDYKRLGFNHGTGASNNPELEANDTSTENNNGPIDIYCNGFKIRSNNPGHNTSGKKYVYAAFAQHPVKIARAR